MKFLTKAKLKLDRIDNHGIKWYSLKQNLILDYKDDLIVVPKELFYTDLASIPYGLQFLYKPCGKYTRSAIIHDYLYSLRHFNRREADRIFRHCMKLDGVDWHTRWLFWCAVRCFGWRFKR